MGLRWPNAVESENKASPKDKEKSNERILKGRKSPHDQMCL